MSPDEIKAKAATLAELFAAKAAGKTLQWMGEDQPDQQGPSMHSDLSDWRVKPEPRTFWVLLNPDGEVIDATRHQARADRWRKDGYDVAETVEVLP